MEGYALKCRNGAQDSGSPNVGHCKLKRDEILKKSFHERGESMDGMKSLIFIRIAIALSVYVT